jgi:hypothetical protein
VERYQQAGISTIATEARLKRFEKVLHILNKLEVYEQRALGSTPAVPKHQTKAASAYLHHTNDHLHPANSIPPSPLIHPTETTFTKASTETPKGNKRNIAKSCRKLVRTRLNGLFATLLSAILRMVKRLM